MRLYELTQEYEHLLALAAAGEGEQLPDLLTQVDAIEAQLEQKCAGIGKVLATLDAEVDAYSTEAQRLIAEAERRSKSAARLREYVRVNMRDRGITEISSPLFKFKLINCPESVVVENEAAVPDEYKRKKVVESVAVDKKAVLAAYKVDGECIAGTRVVRDVRLQIK